MQLFASPIGPTYKMQISSMEMLVVSIFGYIVSEQSVKCNFNIILFFYMVNV